MVEQFQGNEFPTDKLSKLRSLHIQEMPVALLNPEERSETELTRSSLKFIISNILKDSYSSRLQPSLNNYYIYNDRPINLVTMFSARKFKEGQKSQVAYPEIHDDILEYVGNFSSNSISVYLSKIREYTFFPDYTICISKVTKYFKENIHLLRFDEKYDSIVPKVLTVDKYEPNNIELSTLLEKIKNSKTYKEPLF